MLLFFTVLNSKYGTKESVITARLRNFVRFIFFSVNSTLNSLLFLIAKNNDFVRRETIKFT